MHVESENYDFLMYTLNAAVGQDEILLIGQKTVLAEFFFVLQKLTKVTLCMAHLQSTDYK